MTGKIAAAYDSRDIFCKSPFGAVAEGENVVFRVRLHRDARPAKVFLLCLRDGDADYWWHPMRYEREAGGYYIYAISLTFDTGLYFYRFVFDSDYGRKKLFRNPDASARIDSGGDDWQLTVYGASYVTPSNLSGGVYYQIFPDRFCRSGEERPNVPNDRFLNADWGAQPAFRQSDGLYRLGNDFFMGDLRGITEKLGYLEGLGVSIIYLNPIFEAHSNHRYNTADYMKIDPLLGDEDDFRALCSAAREKGITVILDGVFSHVGDDSVYFNRYGRYPEPGAWQSKASKYYPWFRFDEWPDKFRCWWGVPSLPEVNELDGNFCDFIAGEGGVIDHWMAAGAGGFRIDVADELPDAFLEKIRAAVKRNNPNGLLIGEVWEDASNKISYGVRRRFLLGGELDSVMNYPFRAAIIDFAKGGDAGEFVNRCMDLCENYPPQSICLLMNHIGTHDTNRILTELGGEYRDDRECQSVTRLSEDELASGLRLLRIAALLQYTLPGMPSVYYGDEAGMEGYNDPFCRGCYPWGKENPDLLEFYRILGRARRESPVFRDGRFVPLKAEGGLLAFMRESAGGRAVTVINREQFAVRCELPETAGLRPVFGRHPSESGALLLPPGAYELFV